MVRVSKATNRSANPENFYEIQLSERELCALNTVRPSVLWCRSFVRTPPLWPEEVKQRTKTTSQRNKQMIKYVLVDLVRLINKFYS